MIKQNRMKINYSLFILCCLLISCIPQKSQQDFLVKKTEKPSTKLSPIVATIVLPTATITISTPNNTATSEEKFDKITEHSIETITPNLKLIPEDWKKWPIIPTVSANAKSIYKYGLKMGNEENKFSKIGDCQNISTYFLSIYDNPKLYNLGLEYNYLQEAIDFFNGSFSRNSIATKGGMNVASVLSHYWADKKLCNAYESPLLCELRLNNPSIVLISMEETWGSNNKVENYEKYMRQIIDTVIDSGAVPILATKADNKEGEHQINQTIVRLAYQYDIPLWNFWLAVQPLPNHGLLDDGFHLTHGFYDFSEPINLNQAWPVRNLTALQVIDAVWRQLNGLPLQSNK
jgi:hypothetical protein